jgi:ABC-type lipoprotein release transport system permease subunit
VSAFRFILKTLLYHWRSNLALACGVAAGTAVLAGALVVGDSMRASLRRLTLDRLGRIDEALVADQFFRAALAGELAGRPEFEAHFAEAVPAILLRASLEHPQTQGEPRRANRVNLVGCDERFWGLGPGGPDRPIRKHQVVLNEPAARQLGARVGDRVMVRLARASAIPADSPLGRRTGTVESYALEVGAVVPARGLGRFGLEASQQAPRNAYVSLAWLQDRLGQPGKANAILVAGPDAQCDPPAESEGVLQRLLGPALADYSIRITCTKLGYFSITSDRMLLDPVAEAAIVRSLSDLEVQPALTYLANTIACKDREIPYSTVAAVDFAAEPPLGPLVGVDGKPLGPLADDQIVLNDWAAEDLQARPGDAIRLTWFEPETLDGQVRERSAVFRLAAVARLAGAAADPAFTPEVPGLTDKASIDQWDPPFPFDARRIRPHDDRYWRDHRATPKAFVSRAAGKVWESRFGRVTSLRVRPLQAMTAEDLERRIALDPAAMGFVFQPVKRQGLAAAKGTTPFDVLFLMFSMFLIAAAVMLVILLFRLGVDRRAEQLGILLAVGIERRQVVRWLAIEGLIVAALASALGLGLALGYAAGLLAGLRTLWQSAVGTSNSAQAPRAWRSAMPAACSWRCWRFSGPCAGPGGSRLASFWRANRTKTASNSACGRAAPSGSLGACWQPPWG